MNIDCPPNVLRLHPVTRASRLRHSRTHHHAIDRWRERCLVHYHISMRGVAVDGIESMMTAANANARLLSSMLPKGSRLAGLVTGNVENGKMDAVWCVRAMPGLKLPAWSGYTVERVPEEDGS